MKFTREEYLDLMSFGHAGRPMFVELFGLMVGLTSAGMSQESALVTVLLYRLSTFYLPPIWGFFAFRWLQRNKYL